MIDDYKYESSPLPAKNEGLFGLGGKPNEGSRGLAGSIIDYGGGGSVYDPRDGGGGEGGGGDTYTNEYYLTLPDGINGNILYYDGGDWRALGNPGSGGVLINSPSGGLAWRLGISNNSILYFDGTQNQWSSLPAPPWSYQDKYLVIQGGNLTWGDGIPRGFSYGDMLYWDGVNWNILSPPPSGADYVLAINGGTPYWKETTECQTEN